MPKTAKDHWQATYTTQAPDAVSWFQSEPTRSLAMIAAAGLGPDAAVVDVGGGASALVDHLLGQGYHRLSVLDVSDRALAVSRVRLGPRAASVDWIATDITTWTPGAAVFDIWHDRAVFHFLTEAGDRRAYLNALRRGLRPGGYLILATFALTGPDRCSGLPVQRYSPEALQDEIGSEFRPIEAQPEVHLAPNGATQDFIWCLFRREG